MKIRNYYTRTNYNIIRDVIILEKYLFSITCRILKYAVHKFTAYANSLKISLGLQLIILQL